ncbi:hypothetical protein PV10_04505 [Exophiala mesophila]|uniref:ubiquitinyl hydrolase 1 n=1 Tax=Exophiala mesophila TaxID=212818 RepID=A0A0D1ZHI1_EXOME|nr:uncharacterized protein PV10_04505 [Exophiala mesophila]KIV93279.1 hypothetical protein PV10_04505 [Exophiala mesophila]
MNNLPARATQGPLNDFPSPSATPQLYPTLTKAISTLALLILGYYVVSLLDAWPSTLQRSAFEIAAFLLPSRILYAMQYTMVRLGRLNPEDAKFNRRDYGDLHAKQEALKTILGHQPMPFILHRVRSLSSNSSVTIQSPIGTTPPGLGNWDNSCYQNSTLQGLASLPAFLNSLESSLDFCNQFPVNSETHRALAGFLQDLTTLSSSRTVLWTPKILKSMDSWQQQDAQEYFSRILEAIEKEAIRSVKACQTSSQPGLECVQSLFAGGKMPTATSDDIQEQSRGQIPKMAHGVESHNVLRDIRSPLDGLTAQSLRCTTCGFTEGLSLTQFNCLTLNLGLRGFATLEDLIDDFTEPEEVQEVECDRCTKNERDRVTQGRDSTDAINESNQEHGGKLKPVLRTKLKQITLARLPKDLVLHINRSIFDDFGNQRKNSSAIKFPIFLSVSNRWSVPLDNGERQNQVVYELKCVVTHYGRHDNGHYIALGKRDKDWYSFNDERVTKISEEEVLGYGNGFMFFYEAVTPEPAMRPIVEQEANMSEANMSTEVSHDEARVMGARGESSEIDSETVDSIVVEESAPATATDGDETQVCLAPAPPPPPESITQGKELALDESPPSLPDEPESKGIPTMRTASGFLDQGQEAIHLVKAPIVQRL